MQITLAQSSSYIYTQCILYIFVLNNYTVVAPWLWEHHWSRLAPGRRRRAIFRQFLKARLSCLDSKFSFERGNRASPGKQNIQDEKTCESKTANLLVLQPSKEGKTRTPMQKAIVNQYSNLIAGSCDFSFFNEQVNDTYKGLGWVYVPVRRGKSISRKQDRPPNLLFQH